jgi:hypothetical protein
MNSTKIWISSPLMSGSNKLNIYSFEVNWVGPQLLAETDAILTKNLTIKKYFYYIIVTIFGKGSGDRIVN